MPMKSNSVLNFIKRHYVAIFLVYVMSYLLLEPFGEEFPVMYNLVTFQYLGLVLIGPYVIVRTWSVLVVSILLFLMLVSAEYLSDYYNMSMLDNFKDVAVIILTIYITTILFWYTATTELESHTTIALSSCIYMLIAISFSTMYIMLESINPGTFSPLGGAEEHITRGQLLYLSFTTITTLGYGDIVPLTPFAKRLTSIESCLGILYIAIFVGIIIGKFKPKKPVK